MTTPARFILSRKKAVEQYDILKKNCDIVAYSSKTNPDVAVLLQDHTDSAFGIHSIPELSLIRDPSRAFFFAQAWDPKEITHLLSAGVCCFIVDNERDLSVFTDCLKATPHKITLLLRMRLAEHTIHTGKYYVYGMYSDQVKKIIPQLRANTAIEKLGVHFHRKTQNISEWNLRSELAESLDEQTLNQIDYIDIGGGFPIQYKNFSTDVMPRVFHEVAALRGWLKPYNIKIITEPGRFIAAPSITLAATIVNIYSHNIIINCSVYNAAMDTFIASTKLEIEGELEEGEGDPYTIKGITPDTMDIFRYKVYLKQPKIGDTIVFKNAGAYNFATDFCSLPKLKTDIVE